MSKFPDFRVNCKILQREIFSYLLKKNITWQVILTTIKEINYLATAKNGVVLDTTSNLKLFLETRW